MLQILIFAVPAIVAAFVIAYGRRLSDKRNGKRAARRYYAFGMVLLAFDAVLLPFHVAGL